MLELYRDDRAIVWLQDSKSKNRKIGDMAQIWIVPASGGAREVCGDCVLLPANIAPAALKAARNVGEVCYAWEGRAGMVVGKIRATTSHLKRAVGGRRPRWTAIGDPSAIPAAAYQSVSAALAAAGADQPLGYTHGWRTRPDLLSSLMGSADTLADVAEIRALGGRSFRHLPADAAPWRGKNEHGEIACPQWVRGDAITCDECGYCDGGASPRKASVAIARHGKFVAQAKLRLAKSDT